MEASKKTRNNQSGYSLECPVARFVGRILKQICKFADKLEPLIVGPLRFSIRGRRTINNLAYPEFNMCQMARHRARFGNEESKVLFMHCLDILKANNSIREP